MYISPIDHDTIKNDDFRKVVFTGRHLQVVLMSLLPGEEIGMEAHPSVDQFFRIEQGQARFVIAGKTHYAQEGYAVVVPATVSHNVINTSKTDALKLYTLYGPPNHPSGTVEHTNPEKPAPSTSALRDIWASH